ncbi:signal transduction histidine kinase [Roseomonas alkaliterrae]|uniref:histidine kinase n=1 Tax=Neoroseomonas alkaliterrae TaxID=1452450 RepID=A0A840Y3N7_9PROT|nr:signal transduction histidine kinase [Neoroseomonas alkaliterrae]
MTPGEAALRAFEALPHAMMVADGQDRLVIANAALWGEAGADPARFPPGTPLRDLMRLLAFRGMLGPGDPAALAEAALAEDRSILQVRHRRSADGARLSEVTTFPLPGGGFVLCAVDITALNRAEATARSRAALLERVLNAQRSGIALFDAERRLVLHNASYRRHSGATAELLAGRPALGDILEGLERAGEFHALRDRGHLRAVLAADRSRPRQSERERADGTVVRFTSTPSPDGGFLLETEDVTDLRRAEAEARRRAAILDGVLEALPHGICVWGPDRRVALFNDAYLRLMEGAPLQVGDTLEEVIRRRAEAGEYGPGEAAAVYAREMARDLSVPQERRRRRANGTALDVRTAPLPDGGHVSVVTDVTALWKAEEEARRRAMLLETALASMRHGFTLYDAASRVVVANALAERLGGLSPGALAPGRRFEEVVREQVASGALGSGEEAEAIAAAAIALDRTRPHRMRRRTEEGQVLEIASDPTPDGGFVVTHVDVTALAAAEAEAQARAGILRVMLDNTRHGICLFDATGHIVAVNALAARMCGLAPEQMAPGRHLLDVRDEQIAAGEFGDPAAAARFVGARSEEPWRGPDRYTRRRPDGTMLEITTDPTPDGGFVRTYTDVTEDRRIRDELERARAAAGAASEAKSRFLATMSHELRTPLSAVIGFAEAILAETEPGRVATYAGEVRDAGRHLLALIEDILEVARAGGPEAGAGETLLDPAALVASLAAAHGEAAKAAGIAFEATAAPALPPLRSDERRLRRILRALLDNALKFTPAGGTVRLAAAADQAGGLVFTVSDTGIGMAGEDIPRAFEPFTQLDGSRARRYAGSGLGLHLARLLAQAIRADLALESAPGRGTIATLRLPPGITISAQEAPEETA